ncbi:unnamed protein product [Clonostachys rosea]|uniref:Prion-inhibition and propagation HeLo domain-containing protein n=1 Tax=Bionectria ochroleuca TaxID=29856 RepID=A0ABY6TQU7_BIOOC|nr:unnamed protein product [Clonostachys rosea]
MHSLVLTSSLTIFLTHSTFPVIPFYISIATTVSLIQTSAFGTFITPQPRPPKTMAEVAGLAIGAVGLAGLATAALDIQEFGRVLQNFDDDRSIAFQTVQLTSARFDRWRETCFHSGGNPLSPTRDEDIAAIEQALLTITRLFVDLRRLLTTDTSDDPAGPSAPTEPTVREIFRNLGIARKASLSRAGKRFRWAAVDSKRVQELITVIVTFLDQLDKLTPPTIAETHQALVKNDALYLAECFPPEELKTITKECDPAVFQHVRNYGCALNGTVEVGVITAGDDLVVDVGHHVGNAAWKSGFTDNSVIRMAPATTGKGARIMIGLR